MITARKIVLSVLVLAVVVLIAASTVNAISLAGGGYADPDGYAGGGVLDPNGSAELQVSPVELALGPELDPNG